MKHLFVLLAIISISIHTIAQGNGNGKGKNKDKFKEKSSNSSQQGSSQQGSSKHQPKKVQAALLRDYPAANNIAWSKYQGDYTATFNNGPWVSTAVYHANGERRDTRTTINRQQLPGSIWDVIFKRDRVTPTTYIQIERPSTLEKIFRVLSVNKTAYYYDQNGNRITYNY